MNLEKLKETARRFEQKEDWRKAIDVYLKAIHQVEEGTETAPDLSLYNRIGDLYLKINDTAAAVRSYERAVDLYADQGFFNNAIALCGKILRVNPGRTQTYLKLAQLHARKNVVIEAKRNLIEFLERMNALGQLDQAFQSVKAFADQFSGSQEIRMMLVELLRAASREDEAREQLEKLAGELEAVGDTAGARRTREQLLASDYSGGASAASASAPAPAPPPPPSPAPPPSRGGDLIFLDTGFSPPAAVPVSPTPGLVPTAEMPPVPVPVDEVPAPPLVGLETMDALDISSVEPTGTGFDPLVIERVEPAEVDFDGARLDGMEGTPLDLPDTPAAADDPELDELELTPAAPDAELEFIADGPGEASDDTMFDLELAEPPDVDIEVGLAPEPEHDAASLGADTPLPFLDTGPPVTTGLLSLEDRVLDDPENPDLHRDLADALFAADQPDRALDELELALTGYEAQEQWVGASGIVDRFLAVYPDSIRHHQKRVELAFRTGDRSPLISAYLGLGEALARTGAVEKAIAVFRRVEEHDPGNVRAATALAVLMQAVVAPTTLVPDVAAAAASRSLDDVDEMAPAREVDPAISNADASDADVSDADVSDADVSDADVSDADVSDADVSNADVSNADVPYADAAGGSPSASVAASEAYIPSMPRPVSPLARPAVPGTTAPPVFSRGTAPSPPLPPAAASEPAPAPAPAEQAAPPAPHQAPLNEPAGFVDFGAMVLDEQGPRDTRMRVDRAEPTGRDEQREFQEILEQFKRGIEDNLEDDDYDAHYDLGVAFKEMGLLDEAIAEFQRAARSPSAESRLRASEALGVAFYEKGHYPVAETVLRRALDAVDSGDDTKIGLLYWVGRALEAQGKGPEAVASYERALAVDIRFMDIGERVSRLTTERRP